MGQRIYNIKDYRSKPKLSYKEYRMIFKDIKKTKIAKILWRDRKTIYNKLKRNSYENGDIKYIKQKEYKWRQ